ncbi:MAG TPA: DNA-binding domain-containing protein [Kofleriaceae bacterium]|nr:DNA-binding domain-containing protein [Kofleriaceae bacterium]
MKLSEVQRRFWQLISAPVTVERALPELAARDPAIAPLTSWIRAASEQAAIERLDVYANMYFFRLLDVLRDDYPDLARLLGPDHFHNLVTDYLAACPSESPSIRHAGGRLADFLAGHDLARRFPAAPDLARLEWARGLAFDCADGPGELTAGALAAIPAERWGQLRLALSPSFRIVSLDYPVHALWQALERGEPAPPLEPAATDVLIWRRGFTVYHRPAARDEAGLLARIQAGAPFGAVCEQLAARRPGGDDAAVRAAVAFLHTWIDQGLLCGAA